MSIGQDRFVESLDNIENPFQKTAVTDSQFGLSFASGGFSMQMTF